MTSLNVTLCFMVHEMMTFTFFVRLVLFVFVVSVSLPAQE